MVFAILTVYRVLLLGVLVVGSPWWLLRMATTGRYRAGLWGRLGIVPGGLREACSVDGQKWVWVHAVSVGEVLAASEVVRGLIGAGLRVAISTTTQAGQGLARQRFAGSPVFYMPLDFAWIVRRYLRVIQPRLVVTMESELWPNLIHTCKAQAVSLAVANARVSDRSFPRYLRLQAIWGPLLREISLFLAQSEETADRLRAMGVDDARIMVPGNLKYDVRTGERTALTKRLALLVEGRRVVVAGSTLAGEEELLLEAWKGIAAAIPDAVLVIAPRHTDRFDEVLGLMRQAGFETGRCSLLSDQAPPPRSILLLDTIGDLASVYGLGDVAFVGGSLVPRGGHNPLEAAQFGVPVLMGESFHNFREIVGAMVGAGALCAVRPEELEGALSEMLRDADRSRAMGERGRGVFAAQAGAAARTVTALLGLMEGRR